MIIISFGIEKSAAPLATFFRAITLESDMKSKLESPSLQFYREFSPSLPPFFSTKLYMPYALHACKVFTFLRTSTLG